jgi:hypothetical protein
MAISFVFINPFLKKLFLTKKLNLKIASSASTGSHGKYMKYVRSLGRRWWQHVIVIGLHEHCVAAEVIGSKKTILNPQIQLHPSNPNQSIQTVQKAISDQNRVYYDN